MYGRTNAGGGTTPFASIFATYPIGSTCTATNGSRTLKLKDTSGYGVFYVPYAATWIVAATDGTDTASETVEITKEGESVSVELSYRLWLYKNGAEYAETTGGWKIVNSTSGNGVKNVDNIYLGYSGTSGRDSVAYINDKIDLTEINTLYAKINVTEKTNAVNFGVLDTNTEVYPTDGFIVRISASATGEQILQLDVSGVTGKHFIAIHADRSKAYIYEVDGE